VGYDVISIKQMTTKRPSPEGSIITVIREGYLFFTQSKGTFEISTCYMQISLAFMHVTARQRDALNFNNSASTAAVLLDIEKPLTLLGTLTYCINFRTAFLG
jgi:hypothetical protein